MAELLEGSKADNGSRTGSEASNGFEVLDDLANDEAIVDSTTSGCCIKKCFESLRDNKNLQNVVHWRNPTKTGIIFAVGLILLLSLSCFSFISFLGYFGLSSLLVAIGLKCYCRFSKCDSFNALTEREVTLRREDVDAHVQRCLPYLNAAIDTTSRLLRFEDHYLIVKVFLSLICLTIVGDWFDLLTLVTICFVLAFVLPPVYERHHEQIDATLGNLYQIANAKIQEAITEVKKKLSKKQA